MAPPLGIDGIGYTNKFKKRYRRLDPTIRGKVDTLIRELVEDRLSPGRNLKAMIGHPGIYELRVDRRYRLTFRIDDDGIAELTAVGSHDVLDSPK